MAEETAEIAADFDMEAAARQLVQLSEGESTSPTATTSSSSGSCNFNSDNKIDFNFSVKEKLIDDKKVKKRLIKDRDYTGEINNHKIKSPLSSSRPPAGELEDDEDDGGFNRRRKIKRYRSIVDIYKSTKPVKNFDVEG